MQSMPASTAPRGLAALLDRARLTPVAAYALVIALVAVATWLRLGLTPIIGDHQAFITYWPVTILAALYLGTGPGLAAVLLSTVAGVYYVITPAAPFALADPTQWTSLLVFLLVAGWLVLVTGAREQAERERAQAMHRVAEVVDRMADAFGYIDHEWRIIDVNAATARLVGRPATAILGRLYGEVFPSTVGTRIERRFRRALATRMPEHFEHEDREAGIWFEVDAYPSPGGLAVFFRDVTARRRAERERAEAERERAALSAELAERLQEMETLFEVIPIAIALAEDPEVRRIRMNPGFARLLGLPLDTNLSIAPRENGEVPPFTLERDGRLLTPEEAPMQLAAATGQRVDVAEIVFVFPDGRRVTLLGTAAPLFDSGGRVRGAVGAFMDVTANRIADERLRQAQRLESVGRLAGGVAHEVNNQMTVVLGSAALVLRRRDLPDVVRQDVEEILRAGERAAAVTGQLLAFSRRQLLQVTALDVATVVAGLAPVLRRALGESCALELRLAEGLPPVRADRGQFEQVLLNLVLNARDAMPRGGQLTIASGETQLDEQYALQKPGVEVRPGPYVLLTVTDTGHGMDKETLAHVFEPFYTTKGLGKGTGLGLSTVYGIVKQANGYVWAYSAPGQGTTLRIYLPPDTGTGTAAGPEAPATRGGSETVLVVDDEAVVRETARRVLEERGYTVYTAEGGAAALALLADGGRARPHLLLTDLAMPGMSGLELAAAAHDWAPQMTALFMSGYPDSELRERGLLGSDLAFVQKPFTAEVLAERVRATLDGEAPPREREAP